MKPAEFLKDHAIAYFALFAALLGAALFGPIAPSRDLLALWLAGEAVANGLPEQIYPPAAELFIMQPPESWYLRAAEMGWAGEVFPFIYPPIWAWVMAPVTELFSFQGFSRFMFGVNTAALIGLIGTAARLAFPASAGHRPRWLFWLPVALLVYYFSRAGLVSLFQGQPQIVVAFLTVYALERVQAGHPLRGGVAMGLAIALKLSPLPLLVLWLAVGERRAALTALVVASALGLLSLVLAGWPIHARFLALLSSIDHTALVTRFNFSIDAVLAQLHLRDAFVGVETMPLRIEEQLRDQGYLGAEYTRYNWNVLVKPGWMRLLDKALLLGVLAGAAVSLRHARGTPDRALVWAGAMAALALVGPIGWNYYYLAPYAFAPLFIVRAGWVGWSWLGVLLLFSPGPQEGLVRMILPHFDAKTGFAGTFEAIWFTIGCFILAWRPPRPHRAQLVLRPADSKL